MKAAFEIYCDFDGTVTDSDVIDDLLERLADPLWRVIEDRWVSGEIGSRECMALQVPLIRGGWEAVTKVLDEVNVDPAFFHFANWCKRNQFTLRIVSDGIDRVIEYIFSRHGISVDEIWANRLVENDGGFELAFPHGSLDCESGLCKCQILAPQQVRKQRVVIGDGRSDFCWSIKADILFAKKKLLQHCRHNEIECVSFLDFDDVRTELESRIAG